MNDAAAEYRSCAVCGRTILRGESVSLYVTPDGAEATVCELCKPRAEASGWVPAALALAGTGVGRTRRRRGLGLRDRLARVSEAIGSGATQDREGTANGAGEGRVAADRRGPPTPHPARSRAGETETRPRSGVRLGPAKPTREQAIRHALETFNASEARRKVAGLVRSLGEPSVSVVVAADGRATITVAWELSWYQWRVSEGTIEEVAKGAEIDELDERDRDWNAIAAEDGTLRRDRASAAGGTEND